MMYFGDVLPYTTSRYKYNHGGIDECIRVVEQEIDRYECESSGGTSNPYFMSKRRMIFNGWANRIVRVMN